MKKILIAILPFLLQAQELSLSSTLIADGFSKPLFVTSDPTNSRFLYVVEQAGKIVIIKNDKKLNEPFLDISDRVVNPGRPGDERGLLGFAFHPDYESNNKFYVNYINNDGYTIVSEFSAQSSLVANTLSERVIFDLKQPYGNHNGGHMQFGPDGYLYISSGDRQKFDPAQDMQMNLGKILRLNDDGTIPSDNPFIDQEGVAAQVWSLGHRNPLGIDFDADGQLWNVEMGPKGGDELNRVIMGENYGYPIVSNGRHYNMQDIPDHDTRPEFEPPKEWWTPVISPSAFEIYEGNLFPDWKGDGFISGLSSKSLVQIKFTGSSAREVRRFDMGKRIRSVVEGPNGALWLLEDKTGGRLLKLTPSL